MQMNVCGMQDIGENKGRVNQTRREIHLSSYVSSMLGEGDELSCTLVA